MSFAIGTGSKPDTNVPVLISLTRLTRKHAPACVLIGCTIGSRREVPEVHAHLWWWRRDQGRDFDDGGVAVKVGKRRPLVGVFRVKDEC